MRLALGPLALVRVFVLLHAAGWLCRVDSIVPPGTVANGPAWLDDLADFGNCVSSAPVPTCLPPILLDWFVGRPVDGIWLKVNVANASRLL